MGRSAIRDVAQERLPQLTAYLRVLLLLSSMGTLFWRRNLFRPFCCLYLERFRATHASNNSLGKRTTIPNRIKVVTHFEENRRVRQIQAPTPGNG